MSDYYSDRIPVSPLFPAARTTDPGTSRDAAAAATALVADHNQRIVRALALGPAGVSEIGARCRLSAHQVGKRVTQLGRDKSIALTGNLVQGLTGRMEREWRKA